MSDSPNEINEQPPSIPTPRPYHMSDPFQDRGVWCFWLAADDDVLNYVMNLSCILQPSNRSPFRRQLNGRVMFAINPRYDHEETWVWIHDVLASETRKVELSANWESAILEAHENEDG